MANKEVYLTKEGLKELQSELDEIKKVKRPAIVESLQEARAQGDLSENAEYQTARDDLEQLDNKISELEAIVDNVVILEGGDHSKVSIGSKVKIKYITFDEIDTYTIVGSVEADPANNKISNESPIAQAIMGKKVSDRSEVESPNGKYEVEILEIF